MKKLLSMTAVMAIGVLMLSGCGKAGPAGPAGAPGINGNANVIGTNTVALSASSWSAQGVTFVATLNVPSITASVVNTGAVMVYEQAGTTWTALPYTFGIIARIYQFGVSTIYITWENTDGSATANPGNQTYRVVVIPANALILHPHTDWKNYNEVKSIMGFKD